MTFLQQLGVCNKTLVVMAIKPQKTQKLEKKC
jgi:hypothetical protein